VDSIIWWYICGLNNYPMKRFIKAIIIGYSVIWLTDNFKGWFGGSDVKNLEDIKRILKEKL